MLQETVWVVKLRLLMRHYGVVAMAILEYKKTTVNIFYICSLAAQISDEESATSFAALVVSRNSVNMPPVR